jgi:hypothetical protein
MTRLETWTAISMRSSISRPEVDASVGRAVTSIAVASKPRPAFVRGLIAVFGVIAIVLLMPLYLVALPIALAWRAILEMTVERHQPARGRFARASRSESGSPRSFVWK